MPAISPLKNEPRILKDGQFGALNGVNSGTHPALLSESELAFAFNATIRGGFPRTRPKVMQRSVSPVSDEQSAWVRKRRCQMLGSYTDDAGNTVLVVSIAGRVFTIDPESNYAVTEITPHRATTTTAPFISPAIGANATVDVVDADKIFEGYPLWIAGEEYVLLSKTGLTLTVQNTAAQAGLNIATGSIISILDPNDPNLELAWTKQAEMHLVVQNGLDQPMVYDGSDCYRRPLTGGDGKGIPVGKMMEYSQGRLWVVADDRQVAAGDLFDPFNTDSVISFTEEVTQGQFGRFTLLNNPGNVTAIKAIPNLDTSSGQGPLLVFTDLEISSINVPTDRTQWLTQNYPLTRPVALTYGGSSQASVVVVNSDIWNRSLDGIRSFVMANAGFNEWGNVPQSREMDRVLSLDTEELLKFSSGCLFDNRLLMTFGPTPTPNGVKHRGLAVLDFDTISGLRKQDWPAYDGAWGGFSPVFITSALFKGKERCFAICLNSNNENELWEITNENGMDNDVVRIQSWVEGRSMDFKNAFQLKRLISSDQWVNEVVGTVDITLRFKPDYAECWFFWDAKQVCAKTVPDCTDDLTVCRSWEVWKPGYKTRLGFAQPPDTKEPQDNKPARVGYRFQFRIEWTGEMSLKQQIYKAEEVPETEYAL
jgi:hypothetical protein